MCRISRMLVFLAAATMHCQCKVPFWPEKTDSEMRFVVRVVQRRERHVSHLLRCLIVWPFSLEKSLSWDRDSVPMGEWKLQTLYALHNSKRPQLMTLWHMHQKTCFTNIGLWVQKKQLTNVMLQSFHFLNEERHSPHPHPWAAWSGARKKVSSKMMRKIGPGNQTLIHPLRWVPLSAQKSR